jgi:hypothetical protein
MRQPVQRSPARMEGAWEPNGSCDLEAASIWNVDWKIVVCRRV